MSVVQCKHWQGKRVGVDKVRELRGVMAAKEISRGQFATTSTFTDDAITFAKENGVNLLDVKALLALIAKRSQEQQQALLALALEGEYWRPTCVNCGTKMVERAPRRAASRSGAAPATRAAKPLCRCGPHDLPADLTAMAILSGSRRAKASLERFRDLVPSQGCE